jgi:DNA-directed RNA polymerase II subunit RPB7
MFFLITLTKEVSMPPSSFGPNLHEQIRQRVYREVQGTVDGRYGFIIMITHVAPIPRGQIQEGGHAVFPVTYSAVVFKPFRGEVLETIVERVEEIGVWARAGPLKIFISKVVSFTLIHTIVVTQNDSSSLSVALHIPQRIYSPLFPI